MDFTSFYKKIYKIILEIHLLVPSLTKPRAETPVQFKGKCKEDWFSPPSR